MESQRQIEETSTNKRRNKFAIMEEEVIYTDQTVSQNPIMKSESDSLNINIEIDERGSENYEDMEIIEEEEDTEF